MTKIRNTAQKVDKVIFDDNFDRIFGLGKELNPEGKDMVDKRQRDAFRADQKELTSLRSRCKLLEATIDIVKERDKTSEAMAISEQMSDAAELMWCVLANAFGGDWTAQPREWQLAAANARDEYFAASQNACEFEDSTGGY